MCAAPQGKKVKHQDHFSCTIMCGFCGKRRRYDDLFHIKKHERKSSVRRLIARRTRRTAHPPLKMVDKREGNPIQGGGTCPKTDGHNPQRCSFAPPATSNAPSSEEKRPPPSPSLASGKPATDNGESNKKKRELAWMEKVLIAGGREVKNTNGK